MSAYVVSHKHINTLLSFANRRRFTPHVTLNDGTRLSFDQTTDLQTAADILLAENVASVQTRYPDTIANKKMMPGVCAEVGEDITFEFIYANHNPVNILKACDCYDYHTCETGEYDDSDAKKIIDVIRHHAIRALPGYEAAPWGID